MMVMVEGGWDWWGRWWMMGSTLDQWVGMKRQASGTDWLGCRMDMVVGAMVRQGRVRRTRIMSYCVYMPVTLRGHGLR